MNWACVTSRHAAFPVSLSLLHSLSRDVHAMPPPHALGENRIMAAAATLRPPTRIHRHPTMRTAVTTLPHPSLLAPPFSSSSFPSAEQCPWRLGGGPRSEEKEIGGWQGEDDAPLEAADEPGSGSSCAHLHSILASSDTYTLSLPRCQHDHQRHQFAEKFSFRFHAEEYCTRIAPQQAPSTGSMPPGPYLIRHPLPAAPFPPKPPGTNHCPSLADTPLPPSLLPSLLSATIVRRAAAQHFLFARSQHGSIAASSRSQESSPRSSDALGGSSLDLLRIFQIPGKSQTGPPHRIPFFG